MAPASQNTHSPADADAPKVIRIQTARVGSVLTDRDGDTWARTSDGAVCIMSRRYASEWPTAMLACADEDFGPFTLAEG